jgi:glucosamine--fructose-6-phosphate aminotransferase (isomerizing)
VGGEEKEEIMCGIVAYYGKRNVSEVLLDCLQRLEYRGYDSAGIAICESGNIDIIKTTGKIKHLREKIDINKYSMTHLGIGHTRWATHGVVSDKNAHPHKVDNISLVHNGIIENYMDLKEKIEKRYALQSETDSEIIAHLIAEKYNGDLLNSAINTVKNLKGSYALAIISDKEPETLVLVKKENPLIIGIGEDEIFVASDLTALTAYTDNFIILEDENIAKIYKTDIKLYNFNGDPISTNSKRVKLNFQMANKGGYKHYMLKEIFEQPKALLDTFLNHISNNHEKIIFNEFENIEDRIMSSKSIQIIGCGTSYHAAMIGKYLIEKYSGLSVSVDIASEFRYRNMTPTDNQIIIFISQSGETADTLASVKLVKKNKITTIALTNMISSSITRMTDSTIYTYAGPEIGVASTKAFTTQIIILYLFAIYLGQCTKRLNDRNIKEHIEKIIRLPDLLDGVIKMNDIISEIAMKCINYEHFLFLGRNINYPVALEGALKLKEVSYIHAEGYAAGELKHGPIALISKKVPVFVIATQSQTYDKIIGNIEEIKARNGTVYAIASSGDKRVINLVDGFVFIPSVDEDLSIFPNTVIFQLFAYHCANYLGLDVDQPRNLAKSVTVE